MNKTARAGVWLVVWVAWWQATILAPTFHAGVIGGAAVAALIVAAFGVGARSIRGAAVAASTGTAAAVSVGWWAANLFATPPDVWLHRATAFVAVVWLIGLAATWWAPGPTRARSSSRRALPLRAALAASGIPALKTAGEGETSPVKISRGHRVGLGTRYVVRLPDGVTTTMLAGKAEAVAGALDLHVTDLSIDPGRSASEASIWVGDKDAGKAQAGVWPGLGERAKLSALDPIEVGIDRYGQPVTIQLYGGSGVLIAALPGQGKSSMLNLIMASVLADKRATAFIADCKGGADFHAWRDAAERFWAGNPDTDPEGILEIFRASHATMEARYARLPGYRATKIDEELSSEPDFGPLLVVVDEAQMLFGDKSPVPQQAKDEALRLALSVIARGRAVNVWLLVASQRVTSDEIPAAITQRITTRIAFRLDTQHGSQAILGPSAWAEGYKATKLPAAGIGYVAQGAEVSHLRAWFVPDADSYRIAEQAARCRPKLPESGPPTVELFTEADQALLRAVERGDAPQWGPDYRGTSARLLQLEQERIAAALDAEDEDAAVMVESAGLTPAADPGVDVAELVETVWRVWPEGQRGPLDAVSVEQLADTAGLPADWLNDALAGAGAPVETVRVRAADGTRPRVHGLRRGDWCKWAERGSEGAGPGPS